MRQSTEQRRLLAVVVADIVGYSRLMAEDEADTFYRLKDLQGSLIVPATERNQGRIVKWTGDGFLATFDSAVDAVRAAVEIQSGTAAAGASAPDDRRIRFRIGINAGDVIVVPGDVYGDTVNVAARLETLASPGGICIARGVRDTVRGKFSVEFEDRGELAVKNIPDPVGAFDVVFDPIAWTMGRDATHPRARRGWSRYLLAAGILFVVGAAASAAWYFLGTPRNQPLAAAPAAQSKPPTGTPAGPAPSALRTELSARLASAVPSLTEKSRDERASGYETARGHKALAASQDPPGTWRSAVRPTVENAETVALEQCQVFFGQPCVLLAVNEVVQPVPKDGNWLRHDMPRARYAGRFDPAEIPGLGPGLRERSDIANYRSAPSPKAVAYHPGGGRVLTVSGAATQRAAEEEALKTCNAEPARSGADGSCFLYAVGDQVVLPRRLKDPLSTAASVQDLLLVRLASALPGQPANAREAAAHAYETAHGHKAQAVSLQPAGFWHSAERPTADNAEQSALESCQIHYGEPCALLAIDDAVQPVPADGNWPRRDMPRARYAGSFDPAQIPGSPPAVRERADIVNYRSAPSPKAVAFTPVGGLVFSVSRAATQRAAEQEALKACDADPLRKARDGPCFLYAVGDQVVLPRRIKDPMSTAASVQDLLLVRLASALPGQPANARENAARAYETARGHKAEAASLQPAGFWRVADRPTADNAEQSALENCQIFYGQPCALLAIDDAVQPVPADGNWPRRDTPRARYAGSFDPAQIPGSPPAVRERADIVNYRSAPSPKAAAFHPSGGRIFVVTGAAHQRAAEEEALKACNTDRQPYAAAGTCFLYAIADQVVLPRRLKEPLSAAPNR